MRLTEGIGTPPAQQRPQLAVVCTAEHDILGECGIDLDKLGWLREALALNADTTDDEGKDDDLTPLD